jgi:hypothetical protein
MTNGDAAANGHGLLTTQAGVSHDLLEKHQGSSGLFKGAVALFSVMFILGVVGFIIRVTDGVSDRAIWGYYAAVFAFILTTAQAAPMVAIAPRIAKAHWRRPVSRAAEMWTAVGLLNLLLFIPMLWILPDLKDGRRSLWFFGVEDSGVVNAFSPHIWATVALVSLVIVGVALLWVSSLPDLALVRDHSTGWRQRWAARLAGQWNGTSRQWHILDRRVGILGAFYFMMLVFVHFLISIDFAMALIPGWIDALYPITHAANALQAGVATVLLTLFFLRKFGGYQDYITLDQMWGLGKLMFALSLLWFWFWFSSFIILWYGKKPNEEAVLELLMIGPYLPAMYASFVMNFLVPFLTMIWNPLRKSVWGPPLIATSVLAGTFFDRVRLYVAAYSVPGLGDPSVDKHELTVEQVENMSAVMPGLPDVLIVAGAISGSILLYLLASRIIPVMNIWEQKELLLYKIHKPFHRTEVMVLGKRE